MDSAIDDGERLVLRPSRGRSIGLVAGAAGFVLLGVVVMPVKPVYGVVCIVFFGACGVVGASRLLGAESLEIERDGIVVRRLFRSRALAWTQVGTFSVSTVKSQHFVVFQRTGGTPPSALAVANSWLTGANDWLPDTYGRDAHQLAALLNERRERALRTGSAV